MKSHSGSTRVWIFASIVAICLTAFVRDARASASNKSNAAKGCEFSDESFDVANNVHALDNYRDAIAGLLKDKKFKELDCVANAARAGKTRFSGGAWKLRNFYIALEEPRPGHPTEVEWKEHLKRIEQWKDSNPDSVTAPIALAEAYLGYGWAARGVGYTDDVSQSGWKLFGQRAAKAKEILEDVSIGGVKCPDWYIGMQQVAMAQSWPLDQAKALFEKAAKFEPGYQYYYRAFSEYVQPKWSGREGDPARFAEEQGNRIGGDDGDVMYYLIAEKIVCACADPESGYFSWPRMQKGFAALEKKYGPSMISLNAFALMATKNADWALADAEFKRIGDQYDNDEWTSEQWFKQMRDLSAQMGPAKSRLAASRKEAEDSRHTKEGEAYYEQVEHKLAAYEQKCLKEASVNEAKSEVLLLVAKDGDIQDFQAEARPGQFGQCVSKMLYVAHVNKEIPLPPPPHDGYWVLLTLDPTQVSASAK
jgi:hypothetical protein